MELLLVTSIYHGTLTSHPHRAETKQPPAFRRPRSVSQGSNQIDGFSNIDAIVPRIGTPNKLIYRWIAPGKSPKNAGSAGVTTVQVGTARGFDSDSHAW